MEILITIIEILIIMILCEWIIIMGKAIYDDFTWKE